jgi:hypothetical protein
MPIMDADDLEDLARLRAMEQKMIERMKTLEDMCAKLGCLSCLSCPTEFG